MDEMTVQNSNPRKWYEIWIDAWTHPGVETFRRILQEPGVKTSRAFIWVTVTAFVSYLIFLLVYQVLSSDLMLPSFPRVPMTTVWICLTIFSPLLAIVGLSVGAAIYRWIASLFGGTGNWDHLLYSMAVISSPAAIITTLISAMRLVLSSLVPWMSICFSLFTLPVAIYAIVLYVSAIDAVEKVGTGKAILIYFIPVIIGFLIAICIFILITAVFAVSQYS